jgi:hypothetical protein
VKSLAASFVLVSLVANHASPATASESRYAADLAQAIAKGDLSYLEKVSPLGIYFLNDVSTVSEFDPFASEKKLPASKMVEYFAGCTPIDIVEPGPFNPKMTFSIAKGGIEFSCPKKPQMIEKCYELRYFAVISLENSIDNRRIWFGTLKGKYSNAKCGIPALKIPRG